MFLLSPVEFFGQVQARVGKKLSLLFQRTGPPYLSGNIKQLSQSLQQMAVGQDSHPLRSRAQGAIAEWDEANGKQTRDLVTAAVLETVRNAVLRQLATTSDQPITNLQVARDVPSYEALDWSAMEELIQLFEPFLARPKSKKPINRFTFDFSSLLRHSQPEISQLGIAFRSAEHFAALLKKRGVSETAWRVWHPSVAIPLQISAREITLKKSCSSSTSSNQCFHLRRGLGIGQLGRDVGIEQEALHNSTGGKVSGNRSNFIFKPLNGDAANN